MRRKDDQTSQRLVASQTAARSRFPRFNDVFDGVVERVRVNPAAGRLLREATPGRPAVYLMSSLLPPTPEAPLVSILYSFHDQWVVILDVDARYP